MSQTEPASPAYLAVPCTSCIASLDKLDWADERVAVAAGGFVLGVRTNSSAAGRLVRDLFADRIVPGAEPDRNFSLSLTARTGDRVRDLHSLYWAFVPTMRTRSARRALDTLWHELDVRDVRASGTELLFDVTVFVRDGEAHVLPGNLRREVVGNLRRWEQNGYRFVERAGVSVDLDEGVVVVPAPAFPLSDDELADQVAALDLEDRNEGLAVAGRYPIATWTTEIGEHGPATRVGQAAMQVLDGGQHLGPQLLAGLSALLPRVGDLGPSWAGPAWAGMDALKDVLHDWSGR